MGRQRQARWQRAGLNLWARGAGKLVRRRRAAALAASVVALAGCAAGGEPVTEPHVRAALAALADQPAELWSAHEIVRRDCMRHEGFDLPFTSAGYQAMAPQPALTGLGGLFASEAGARGIGYHETIRDVPAADELAEQRLAEADPARYEAALRGQPPRSERLALENGAVAERSATGCLGTADSAVFGSARNALEVMEFVNGVNIQADKVRGSIDRVLREGLAKHSQCMAGHGYRVASLNAGDVARDTFGVYREPGDPPSEKEQAMAVADFRCQQEAGLAAAINEEFLDKSGKWAAANEASILANYEILTASLARAKAILAQG